MRWKIMETESIFTLLDMISNLSKAVLCLYNPDRNTQFSETAHMAEDFHNWYNSLSNVDKFDYCLDIMDTTNKKIRQTFIEQIKES